MLLWPFVVVSCIGRVWTRFQGTEVICCAFKLNVLGTMWGGHVRRCFFIFLIPMPYFALLSAKLKLCFNNAANPAHLPKAYLYGKQSTNTFVYIIRPCNQLSVPDFHDICDRQERPMMIWPSPCTTPCSPSRTILACRNSSYSYDHIRA